MPTAMSQILDGSAPFQLTHLSLKTECDDESDKNIAGFPKSQSKTVISLNFYGLLNSAVYQSMFSSFENLKSLSLYKMRFF